MVINVLNDLKETFNHYFLLFSVFLFIIIQKRCWLFYLHFRKGSPFFSRLFYQLHAWSLITLRASKSLYLCEEREAELCLSVSCTFCLRFPSLYFGLKECLFFKLIVQWICESWLCMIKEQKDYEGRASRVTSTLSDSSWARKGMTTIKERIQKEMMNQESISSFVFTASLSRALHLLLQPHLPLEDSPSTETLPFLSSLLTCNQEKDV